MNKFADFNRADADFKTVDGVGVGLTVLTPKGASGKCPVIVRWHGGFLFTGARMLADWFPNWVLQFAQRHNAIIVTPDYRLLPECTGTDILADVADFFAWLPKSLSSHVSSQNIQPDLTHVLVTGESAGGWLAIQSALLHGDAPGLSIRAAISAYGVLDIKTPFFTKAYDKPMLGLPMFPADELDKHKAKIAAGEVPRVITASNADPARVGFMLSSIQHGRYAEVLGPDSVLYPMENVERVRELVPLWLFHGRQDTAVPVEGSINFYEKTRKVHPHADILLTLEEGEHGFDKTVTLDTPWMKEGLAWTVKRWLGEAKGSSL